MSERSGLPTARAIIPSSLKSWVCDKLYEAFWVWLINQDAMTIIVIGIIVGIIIGIIILVRQPSKDTDDSKKP